MGEEENDILYPLFELLSIPSVTQDRANVRFASDWLLAYLSQSADHVRRVETTGNPVILAEWRSTSGGESPTVLLYGHYDVQPPGDLNQWSSDPFKPEVRDGRLFARGAGDNKGQFYAHLQAIEHLVEHDSLAWNVKLLLDGDEEQGSPFLAKAMEENLDFFQHIDLIIVSDGPAHVSWRPSLVFGARGILTFQLNVRLAKKDVHSGNFGGIQPNAAWALLDLIGTLREPFTERCLVKGFYDEVIDPDLEATKAALDLPLEEDNLKEQLGISFFGGESSYPLTFRVMFRPTINLRGISSGGVKSEARTIIPAKAVAELDCRLVPYQDPKVIAEKIRQHFQNLREDPRYARILASTSLSFGASFKPLYTPVSSPWTSYIEQAMRAGFDQDPVRVPLLGGSLPVAVLHEKTNAPLFILPYAQPDQSNHAPNENILLSWFYRGIETSKALFSTLPETLPE